MAAAKRAFNAPYESSFTDRIAFPLGGMGAGMIALEGAGALSHVSLRNNPDIYHEPQMFAAVSAKSAAKGAKRAVRLLEGPVPKWKYFGMPNSGMGAGGKTYGLPRFDRAKFTTRFPFAEIKLSDDEFPLEATLTGWSPFTPPDADTSSLPCAALEYTLTNPSRSAVDAIFSFHSTNFMKSAYRHGAAPQDPPPYHVDPLPRGFALCNDAESDAPHAEGAFAVSLKDDTPKVNCGWFRGGWFDPLSVVWRSLTEGTMPTSGRLTEGVPSSGGSLYLQVKLAPKESRKITVLLSWFVPKTNLQCGGVPEGATPEYHAPWYASRFSSITEVDAFWRKNYAKLHAASSVFADAFYDSTLPPEIVEAAAANLTILKSPTVLRQFDGRMWAWEGMNDNCGSCRGTCTHVWNYAMAVSNLFPSMERTLRETEFNENQAADGKQMFRALLPIRRDVTGYESRFHAAADGQLGGIMKLHREWRASGSDAWLATLWPQAKASMEYCIRTWDPDEKGGLFEPHHNTYDIEFWGPDGMCGSFYVGALKAMSVMASALGDDPARWETLYKRARAYTEENLWNGEYFFHDVRFRDLRAPDPATHMSFAGQYSTEALALMQSEGPKYQYGKGCLADGVLGAWIAARCGLGEILDPKKVKSHLLSVHRYNFKPSLKRHANPQRPTYAIGDDAGLLLCTWPNAADRLTLPFPYSEEVWTGIEYQVASHLLDFGCKREAADIVRGLRARYDGRVRNPFNEYECGSWYARALASYGLLESFPNFKYDAKTATLTLAKKASDGRYFLAGEKGFGTVEVKAGAATFTPRAGKLAVKKIVRA